MTKRIGIIGGVSWESTALYYQLINQTVRERLGGLNSANLLIHSLNYEPIVEYERQANWKAVTAILVNTAQSLEGAGADFIILGCNTLHMVAAAIEDSIHIPFVHIADAAGEALLQAGIKKVGLLGTQFTMEDGFYARRLKDIHALETLVPPLDERKFIDDLVYKELCVGKVLEDSRLKLTAIMKSLAKAGAEAILLGCTELGMLAKPEDSPLPLFDTTLLHAEKAAHLSLL